MSELGAEARRLLYAGDFSGLSRQLGYALAFGRDPADGIREALAACLAELGAGGLVHANWEAPRVSYFKANDTGLHALVECLVPTDNGRSVLVEVIVTAHGTETHATLEQLSAVIGPQ